MAEGGDVSLRSGSEYIYNFFCEVCVDDNKHLEAFGFCNDCNEYLCEECYNAHKRPRSTRHHVLKDKNNMPKNTPMSTDRVNKTIVTRCKSHSATLVEFYCKAHDVFGCSTCFATVHKNCQKVESVQEESVNILDSKDYKQFLLNLTKMKENAEEIIERTSSNTLSVQKCCSEFVAAIRKTKEELIKVLNEAEDSMVSLAKRLCSEDEGEMKNLATECKDLSTRLEEISSEIESLQSSKRICQLYIAMKETAGEINTLGENLRSSQRRNVVRMYRFEPQKDAEKVLKAPDVLGKIVHLNQPVDDVQHTTPVVPKSLMASKDADAHPKTPIISNVTDIDVSSSSDTKAFRFTGSAVLPNNRVALVDRNNFKVKLVDTHANKLISEHKLPSLPWDITVVSQNKVAVTLPDSGKIILLDVKNRIKKDREINVGDGCCGVAYIQDRLVVSYKISYNTSHVKIIDLRGNVIRNIKTDSDGRQLFEWPLYVCVSNDGETIYVSDCDRHTVTSLTLQGDVKSVYEDEQLRYPRGMCTDQNGNVYVCGYGSKNVHMITADCKKVNVILTQAGGLNSSVTPVSYCQDTNRLFIGMHDTKYIKVFKLS